jgi:hypothetical protein
MRRSLGAAELPRRCKGRLLAVAAVLAWGAGFAVSAGHAVAAPYTVIQCDSGYSVAHDWGFGTFHPGTFYGEDACGGGSVLRVRARPYTTAPHGFGASWGATAPDWTAFTRFQADFQGGSNGSLNTAPEVYVCGDVWCSSWRHLVAWGNGGDSSGIPGVPGWGSPGTRSWSGSGGRVVRFGLGCAFGDCQISQWGAGIDMFGARFQLDDQAAPDAPSFSVPGGWRRGTAYVSYSASDRGAGVRQVHLHAGGTRRATDTRSCWTAGGVYTRLIPCPLAASGSIALDTSALADGLHEVNVLAEDASGQGGWGGAQTVRVDNHAPTAPANLSVDGGDGWRPGNGFGVRWTNPAGQHAPLTRVHYTLCKAGGGCAPPGARTGPNPVSLSDLAVPGAGDWLLRVYLEDEAGNVDSSHHSEAVHLRFDPDPPERVEFEPPDPEDPQRIAVAVADATSGIAGGQIELRPEGGEWLPVPTALDGSHLIGRIDDAALAPGFYELRASARDQAGNERSSQDGPQSRQRLYLPVRLRSQITLRAVRPACATARRGTGARTKRRCRTGFIRSRRASVWLRFRGRALVHGQVQTVDGVEIRGGAVDVLFRHRATDRPPRTLGRIQTDADGRFTYLLPRGPSGTYRFRYEGSARFGPGSSDLVALVRARLSFRASKRHAANGDTVTFSGRLVGRPVPPLGRTVDVQAWIPGFGWRTFATPRTDRKGHFAVPYTFRFTSGVQRYRLRALLERSGDYPYERAVSRIARVTVRGP